MLGVIGVGACGGNIADEMRMIGIPSVAINYSESDLKSLSLESDKKLLLVGSEGVGKRRDKATKLIEDNWETTISFIENKFLTSLIEVVMVVFSMGGGTGSGLSPVLIEIMQNKFPDKVFVAVPILPMHDESISSHINFIKSSEELSALDICVMPIDNQSIYNFTNSASIRKTYDTINSEFVKIINDILKYTETGSRYGVLDKKDFQVLLSTKGIANISYLDLSKYDSNYEKDIIDLIRVSWHKTIFVNPESNEYRKVGIIIDSNKNTLEEIDLKGLLYNNKSSNLEDLFEGYYISDGNKVYTILTGLPWYKSRLKVSEKVVSDSNKNKSVNNDVYKFKINKDNIDNQSKIKKSSIQEILKKYRR